MIKIAPSILSADFANLERDIQRISTADYVHVDVMDGMFVPNITIGIPVVKSIRPTTALPLDVHLMIVEPGRYVEQFCDAGADLVTVHVESDTEEKLHDAIARIQAKGKRAGVVLKPKTPAETVLPFLNEDIEDFKDSQHVLDYIDDDFAIVNSLEGTPYSNDTIKLNCFLIAVCIEGCIQLDVNYRTYKLQAGELLLGLPNTIISHTMLSPKYKVRLAGFSTRFLQRIIKMEKETWNTAIHIHNNPVKSVDNGEDQTVFGFYRDLIIAKINDEPHRYHKEVIQHLFSAIFCEMMGQLHKEIEASGNMEGSKEGIKQVNYILRKFMELLSKDKGMHRSVSYFANELCYTPKHFSKVIKQACGRTPLDLINETTVEHIKYRLKRSEKSIKEIAEEFNFPNQSFFGKYVKAHLGTSPANYRNRKEE